MGVVSIREVASELGVSKDYAVRLAKKRATELNLKLHGKSPLDAPPGRAGRKKACCQRQHQSCKLGARQFGVPATVSTTPAIIWCGRPSTASGCCKERYGSAYENYFWR